MYSHIAPATDWGFEKLASCSSDSSGDALRTGIVNSAAVDVAGSKIRAQSATFAIILCAILSLQCLIPAISWNCVANNLFPQEMALRTPPLPKTTLSAASGLASIANVILHDSTTCPGESASVAPAEKWTEVIRNKPIQLLLRLLMWYVSECFDPLQRYDLWQHRCTFPLIDSKQSVRIHVSTSFWPSFGPSFPCRWIQLLVSTFCFLQRSVPQQGILKVLSRWHGSKKFR